ncbi:hypothetical protein DUI87_17092 [Hirundo rustica rustica]|uniref:V-SNARE coiled-coil homology domain-containing protein n=1 Tax=Hirundo rustica rustica TaxID=333673 RepID=A0A3M0K368_HIRRU|nr:hypothetical protein DUI87_17092 [Hirundo rustica rustica]
MSAARLLRRSSAFVPRRGSNTKLTVVDIMCVNVDKVLQRDEKLSELDDRADALQAGASVFESSAAKLKRKYWWKNCKMMIMMGVIGALVVVVIASKYQNLRLKAYTYLKFCPSMQWPGFHCKMMVVPVVLDCLWWLCEPNSFVSGVRFLLIHVLENTQGISLQYRIRDRELGAAS